MEAAGCGLCSETKSIVAFCRECKEFMCDDCEPLHKRMIIFSDHETVPVNIVNNTCAVLSANNTYDLGSPVQVSLVAPTATIEDVSSTTLPEQGWLCEIGTHHVYTIVGKQPVLLCRHVNITVRSILY